MTDQTDQREAQLLAAMSVDDEEAFKTEYKAVAGSPLNQGLQIADEKAVVEALRGVYDPEIPVNVYDMGLIYHIDIEKNGNIFIEMTLTAPGCPVAGILPQQVADAVSVVQGAGVVEVRVVWEPQWTIERMTEEGRAMIDLF